MGEAGVPCLGGSSVALHLLPRYGPRPDDATDDAAPALFPPEFVELLERDLDRFQVAEARWRVVAACERVTDAGAQAWVRAVGRRCVDFADFRAEFLDEFWSETRQVDLLRSEMYGGAFDADAGESVRDYFSRLARLGRSLGESEGRTVRCALRNLAPVLGPAAALVAAGLPKEHQVDHLDRVLKEFAALVEAVPEAVARRGQDAEAGVAPKFPFCFHNVEAGSEDAAADGTVAVRHRFAPKEFRQKAVKVLKFVFHALFAIKSVIFRSRGT